MRRDADGYYGGMHTVRERAWYLALSDKVGHKNAPDYADAIIVWHATRPGMPTLNQWQREYDDGLHHETITEDIRAKVGNRVDKHHKQEHRNWLRQMMKAGVKLIDSADEHGNISQPQSIKYLADGVNQGMLAQHEPGRTQGEVNLGGLTINVGKPPPRKLRARDKPEQLIEAEFKELPVGSTA